MDYAQRLSNLPNVVTSVQRRHERYKILYAYKIKEGLVPNISKTHGLDFVNRGRRGRVCIVPNYPLRGKAIGVRERSFALTTCNLWNSLPRCIRDIKGRNLSYFKKKLDNVLSHYPDVPRCSTIGHTYDKHNIHKSNSIYDHYRDRTIRQLVDSLRV